MTRQKAKKELSIQYSRPKPNNANGKEPRDYSVIYDCYEALKR